MFWEHIRVCLNMLQLTNTALSWNIWVYEHKKKTFGRVYGCNYFNLPSDITAINIIFVERQKPGDLPEVIIAES
jgi:hypothetical protein